MHRDVIRDITLSQDESSMRLALYISSAELHPKQTIIVYFDKPVSSRIRVLYMYQATVPVPVKAARGLGKSRFYPVAR